MNHDDFKEEMKRGAQKAAMALIKVGLIFLVPSLLLSPILQAAVSPALIIGAVLCLMGGIYWLLEEFS